MRALDESPFRRDADPEETNEWLEALDGVVAAGGAERAAYLLQAVHERAQRLRVAPALGSTTPYVNTIPVEDQPPYPGDRALERRLKSLVRWNAMAMVVRANKELEGIGGHISTFASAATLYEVGFNHFWRARSKEHPGDLVYVQGHAAPGIYARAFLEGRLSAGELANFRRELGASPGLASYPHPWLMPHFWQFPTVSMGLGPIMGIYQARFNRYLQDRGLVDLKDSKVWVMIGDGETDEPESLGAISLAAREKLDNLIFVVNANLQRLDGPVRGNGKIIQELETVFCGAGWNVIKVVWGGEWDALLARDVRGLLARRMREVVDGQYQKYSTSSGEFIRKDFFGADSELLALVAHLSDEELRSLRRGGHDPEKVYAAFKAAVEHRGAPTVVIAKTVKGYGLGEAGEGKNITHQQKKLNEEELRRFRSRFGIPLSDDEVPDMPFYRPPEDSPEIEYLKDCRARLGGPLPARAPAPVALPVPKLEAFREFLAGSGGRPASTTMAFVRLLSLLLHDKELGKRIVPIVPDEARTFGMEALFREFGIYSHVGQLYEPVDAQSLLFYREARDGQVLEEGINEAGAMCSFIAAASAYATHGVPCIPFFVFYSMFGFQRIGDLIWAAGDMRCRGFLLGATSGRTTLNGEGLQHQDGHSHVLASTVPTVASYDPAFGYEIAVIVQDGLRRMYADGEDVFYYLTLANENYPQPPMPEGAAAGIRKGMYKLRAADAGARGPKVHLLGSGTLLREALRAQELLGERFHVAADVWSVPSYTELERDALCAERWNMLHPEETPRTPYVTALFAGEEGPVIAVSDYVKSLAHKLAPWLPRPFRALGTDGFGRSDSRAALRRHFEVDAESAAVAALYELARLGRVPREKVATAIKDLGVDPEKPDPLRA